MKQKIIMIVALLTLVSLVVFVSASMSIKTANENKYLISVEVSKGWNLISGIYPPQQISQSSEIQLDDIKAVWFYTPIENKYIEIYPNLDKRSIDNYDDEYVFSSAMWVYSERAGTISYDSIVYFDFPKINSFELTSGWNFLTITPEMIDIEFNSIKGDCNIENIYTWDSSSQEWNNFPTTQDFEEEFEGRGFIIKVSSDCTLGSSSEDGTSPPILPEDEGAWRDYVYQKDIGKIIFNTKNKWSDKCMFANNGAIECNYYSAGYEYSTPVGLKYVSILIEDSKNDFDLSLVAEHIKEKCCNADGKSNLISRNIDENFIMAISPNDNSFAIDSFIAWKSDKKLIILYLDDIVSLDDSIITFEELLDKYLNKYPSIQI